MNMIVAVAAGGAFGAVGRYLMMNVAGHWLGHGFPYGTLLVNVLGSLALGALIELMALTWSPGEEMRAFLVVGILGSFTTFSTFSLDVVTLIERNNHLEAALYVAGSVFISVIALFCGMAALRQVLT